MIEESINSTDTKLLDHINSPADLRALDESKLPQVCEELRSSIIEGLSVNPGHFGSSMGAVDIIVALHYVFNTPRDHIVFDVGHQAYAHKLLTGRRDAFRTQRQLGGISGFPTPSESEYDTFTCGHAGNSISAALGMAIADLNTPGNEDINTVALIGDASIGNGLAFEGINNAAINPNNLLIILNDNDMSISANVGALHRYLSDLTTSARYNNWRYSVYKAFRRKGFMDDNRRNRVLRFGNALKSLVSNQQNIFEGLNIRYFGPFNGNDVNKVVKVLRKIKDMRGPRILHLHTTKGYGYAPAMENPSAWHAPGMFVPATGERVKSDSGSVKWQEVFGKTLLDLADAHKDVIGITAAMSSGTSIDMLQKKHPEQVYDVGISEGHAVTFAGGLASEGKHPFIAIYSAFLQRAYDNIIHDVAIQHLPVTFCIDRAGLVGEDGVTHHGIYDIRYMADIPGMYVAAPADGATLRSLMATAYKHNGPMAIRYPRGNCGKMPENTLDNPMPAGKGRVIMETPGAKTALLSVGPILSEALKAADLLKDKGIEVSVYDMIWVKPLDKELLRKIAVNYDYIVTIEDGTRSGGFGSIVLECVSEEDLPVKVTRIGISDNWVAHGTVNELRHLCGIDANAIANTVEKLTLNSKI